MPEYADDLDHEGFILKREYLNKIKFVNDDDYQERYFTIEKTQDKIKSGQTGKYLIILPYMEGFYDIENTEINKGDSKVIITKKYSKQKTENPIIFFDTSDFKVGDEIYLIFSGVFYDDEIYYAFIDDFTTTEISEYEVEKSNKVKTKKKKGNNYESRYYTFKKTEKAIQNSEGKYLMLLTNLDGEYEIENTEENKGNNGNTAIIIVVIVVVVVIAVIIFIICYCKKKKQAANNQENHQDDNNVKVYNNEYNTNGQIHKSGNQGFNNNSNDNDNYSNDLNVGPKN